jgi:hypothetical protein
MAVIRMIFGDSISESDVENSSEVFGPPMFIIFRFITGLLLTVIPYFSQVESIFRTCLLLL